MLYSAIVFWNSVLLFFPCFSTVAQKCQIECTSHNTNAKPRTRIQRPQHKYKSHNTNAKSRIISAFLHLVSTLLGHRTVPLLTLTEMPHSIWLTGLMDLDIPLGDACWCLSAAKGPVSSTCRFAHLHPDSSLCKCELVCLWKWVFFFSVGKNNWSHSWGG